MNANQTSPTGDATNAEHSLAMQDIVPGEAQTPASKKAPPKMLGSTPARKRVAKNSPAKPAPVLTGAMAVAEDLATKARAIAAEAAKLSGPLKRTKAAKENEIKDHEAAIEKAHARITRLRNDIVELDGKIVAAEADAIATLNRMAP